MISYLSICSGIEAWSVACEGLGFTAAGFSEIEAFPSAVLAQRFGSNMPGEPLAGNAPPNFGDFTGLIEDKAVRARLPTPLGLLVGGTPCQAFSFAGKRLSLADARGNLTLAFAVLAHELARSHGLRNAVWENVPGVLSAPDNAFGCFLGALVGSDAPLDLPAGIGRWPDEGMVEGPRARAAWRVLDAQYFRLAQRRERVFVVVDFGNGADPAAVLFEPQGLQGNSPPRREAGQKPAPTVAGGARSRGGYSHDDIPLVGGAYGGGNRSGSIDVAATLTAKGQRIDFEVETFIAEVACTLPAGGNETGGARQPGMGAETAGSYLIAHTLRGEGFDASEDGSGRGIPLVPVRRGPCVKQRVLATIISPSGAMFVGENDCENPQATCPRAGMPTGVGYELCASVCRQTGHAEVNALRAAGSNAHGGVLYLEGHTYACEPCKAACAEAGIAEIVIGAPPSLAVLRGHSDYGDGLPCLRAEAGAVGGGSEALIAFSSKDTSVNASVELAPTLQAAAGRGHGAGLAIAFDARQSDVLVYGDRTGPLDTDGHSVAIVFSCKDHGGDATCEVAPTLRAMGHGESHPNAGGQIAVAQGWAVRRLIVDECARLQGFPDGWTRIPWRGKPAELCPDGPQYKAYGNSMAVKVMRWLAERLEREMTRTA